MSRAEILAAAVHSAWGAVSLSLGEAPVSWELAEPWRLKALHHTIGFWESWHQYDDLDVRAFCAATHLTWLNYHRRNKWAYTDLVPYSALSGTQQQKLPAMLRQYLFTRALIEQRVPTS